jgi:hypothetical protein
MDEKAVRLKSIRIVSVLLIGALMLIPFVCQLIRFGVCYPFIGADEAHYVGPLVRYGQERGFIFNEPFVYEYRDERFPYPSLPFVILGIASKIVGLEALFFCLHILGPVLIFLILRRLLECMGVEPIRSIVGAFFYVAFFHIIDSVQIFTTEGPVGGLFFLQQSGYPMTWAIFRIIDPAFTRIFFFGALLLFVAAQDQKSYRLAILAGIATSLVIYLRFYDWTLLMPMLVILVVKNLRDGNYLRIGITSLVVPVICLALYVIERNSMLGKYPDTFYRSGTEPGVYFWPARPVDLAIAAVLIAVNILLYRTPLRWYCIAYSASLFIVMNAQLVLGYNVGPFHWKVVHVYPLIAAVLLTTLVLMGRKLIRSPVFYILPGIILVYGLISYTRYKFIPFDGEHVSDMKRISGFVGPHDVVLSGKSCDFMLYKHCYVFVPPFASFSSIPADDLYARWILQKKLVDGQVDVDELKGLTYLQLTRYGDEKLPGSDEYRRKLKLSREDLQRWKEFAAGVPDDAGKIVLMIAGKYKLDWIVVGSSASSRFSSLQELESVYVGKKATLYRVKK